VYNELKTISRKIGWTTHERNEGPDIDLLDISKTQINDLKALGVTHIKQLTENGQAIHTDKLERVRWIHPNKKNRRIKTPKKRSYWAPPSPQMAKQR
jgi:hypothetical protein